jgi:hypothetical protein
MTCVFDVQQNLRPFCGTTPRWHAALYTALHAFSVFNLIFSSCERVHILFLTCVLENAQSAACVCATQCRVRAAQPCAARLAAMISAFSVIGRKFCCMAKTQVFAADGLLHIQIAHQKRKRNRPLTYP